MAQQSAQRSYGVIPGPPAASIDEASRLTTSYSLPVGVGSAKTVQLDIVAEFTAQSDEVIIQVQRNGTTENLTYGYGDFDDSFGFTAGTYRTSAHVRGHHITGLRIGLSSTATVEKVTCGPAYA